MFEKIIWISGMPRSGTNWLSQIFASSPDVRLKLCPLFSYEFKNSMDEQSTPRQWRKFFEAVYSTKSEYMDQEYVRKDGLVPRFEKKDPSPRNLVIKSTRFHSLSESILEKSPETRFLAIVRHPCAVIHSWLTNPLEFPEGADPATEWRTGACRKTGPGEFWGFEDWKRVTLKQLDLARQYPDRFLMVGYEALVRDAHKIIREIFASLDLPYTGQTSDFLRASQSTHSEHQRSVYKSPKVAERWRHELDPGIADAILAELAHTPLEQFIREQP